MPKTCKIESCSYKVFTHGYCKKHKGYWYNSAEAKAKKVSKNTPLRKELEKWYKIMCNHIDHEAEENDKWKCFFCGKSFPANYKPSHHHLSGREGMHESGMPLLVYKPWIVPVHDDFNYKCHTHGYHSMSAKKLPWFDGYLGRIKIVAPELYDRELSKLEK